MQNQSKIQDTCNDRPFECIGQVVQLDRGFPLVEIKDINQDRTCIGSNPMRCEYGAGMHRENCVIGDFVRLSIPNKHDHAQIVQVLDRNRILVRKDPSERAIPQVLAANFDLVLVVQSSDNINLARLQRELVVAKQTGARVAILLTKADLVYGSYARSDKEKLQDMVECVRELAGDEVRIHEISTQSKESIEVVRELISPNTLAVLMGKSGVGKSSLINALLGDDASCTRETGEVRERDGKGRHTTVNRAIVNIPHAGRVVDMPGVRGIGMWEAEDGVCAAFQDIESLARECKFRDCTHTDEPDCRVQAALKAGEISNVRLNAYLSLMNEIKNQRTRAEEHRRHVGNKKSDIKKKANKNKNKSKNKKYKRKSSGF